MHASFKREFKKTTFFKLIEFILPYLLDQLIWFKLNTTFRKVSHIYCAHIFFSFCWQLQQLLQILEPEVP
jgi:hypothetical protein